MVVEERKEQDSHWETVTNSRFNWCEEDGYVFDLDNQFVTEKNKRKLK